VPAMYHARAHAADRRGHARHARCGPSRRRLVAGRASPRSWSTPASAGATARRTKVGNRNRHGSPEQIGIGTVWVEVRRRAVSDLPVGQLTVRVAALAQTRSCLMTLSACSRGSKALPHGLASVLLCRCHGAVRLESQMPT